jgi:hypothetical protein
MIPVYITMKISNGQLIWNTDMQPYFDEMTDEDLISLIPHLAMSIFTETNANRRDYPDRLYDLVTDLRITGPIIEQKRLNSLKPMGRTPLRWEGTIDKLVVLIRDHSGPIPMDEYMKLHMKDVTFGCSEKLALLWLITKDKFPIENERLTSRAINSLRLLFSRNDFNQFTHEGLVTSTSVDQLSIVLEVVGSDLFEKYIHKRSKWNRSGKAIKSWLISYESIRWLISHKFGVYIKEEMYSSFESYFINLPFRKFSVICELLKNGDIKWIDREDSVVSPDDWAKIFVYDLHRELLQGRNVPKLTMIHPFLKKETSNYLLEWTLNYCHIQRTEKWYLLPLVMRTLSDPYIRDCTDEKEPTSVLHNGLKFLTEMVGYEKMSTMIGWKEYQMQRSLTEAYQMREILTRLEEKVDTIPPTATNLAKLQVEQTKLLSHYLFAELIQTTTPTMPVGGWKRDEYIIYYQSGGETSDEEFW